VKFLHISDAGISLAVGDFQNYLLRLKTLWRCKSSFT